MSCCGWRGMGTGHWTQQLSEKALVSEGQCEAEPALSPSLDRDTLGLVGACALGP